MANCEQPARRPTEFPETYFITVNTYLHDAHNNIHRNATIWPIREINVEGTQIAFTRALWVRMYHHGRDARIKPWRVYYLCAESTNVMTDLSGIRRRSILERE